MLDLLARAARIVMIAGNAGLALFGSSCVLLGGYLLVNPKPAMRMITKMYTSEGVVDALNHMLINNDSFIRISAYAFCTVGLFAMFVGACGVYGAWKENSQVLYFYSVMLSVLVLQQLAHILGLLFYKEAIRNVVKSVLSKLQDEHYVPMSEYISKSNSTTKKVAATRLINTIQIWFECCGAEKLGDTALGRLWRTSNKTRRGVTQVRPKTCCKLYDTEEKKEVIDPKFELKDIEDFLLEPDCPYISKDIDWAVHNKTCSQAVSDHIVKYTSWLVLVCVAIVLTQICGLTMTCVLIRDLKYDYDDDDDDDD